MADKELKYTLTIDAKTGKVELDGIEASAKKVENSLKNIKIAGNLTEIWSGFNILKTGIMSATNALSSFVAASNEAEQASFRFAAALEMAGAAGQEAEFRQLAEDLKAITTLDDDLILANMQLALSYGATANNLEQVTKGAIGLANAYNIDLSTATRLATLAANGEFEALTRTLPQLRGVKDEAEAAAIVNKAMADGFVLAQKSAQTFAGQMEKVNVTLGDYQEKIGDLVKISIFSLVKGFEAIGKAIGEVLFNLTEKFKAAFDLIKAYVLDSYDKILFKTIETTNAIIKLLNSIPGVTAPYKLIENDVKIIDRLTTAQKNFAEAQKLSTNYVKEITKAYNNLFTQINATAIAQEKFENKAKQKTKEEIAKQQAEEIKKLTENLKTQKTDIKGRQNAVIVPIIIEPIPAFEPVNKQIEDTSSKFRIAMIGIQDQLAGAMSNTFSSAAMQIIKTGKTTADIWEQLFDSMLNSLIKKITDKLSENLINSAFDVIGSFIPGGSLIDNIFGDLFSAPRLPGAGLSSNNGMIQRLDNIERAIRVMDSNNQTVTKDYQSVFNAQILSDADIYKKAQAGNIKLQEVTR